MSKSSDASVLIVEDDQGVAETFRKWLENDYEVHVVLNGKKALEKLEKEDIDVVLLDRLMPGLSGDEVLEKIKENDKVDCRVAMVTAIKPDFEIIEMGFDEYITKPSSSRELQDTVERLYRRSELNQSRRKYASLRDKQATLETSKTEEELVGSEEYKELLERLERLVPSLEEADRRLTDGTEFISSLREIQGGTEVSDMGNNGQDSSEENKSSDGNRGGG